MRNMAVAKTSEDTASKRQLGRAAFKKTNNLKVKPIGLDSTGKEAARQAIQKMSVRSNSKEEAEAKAKTGKQESNWAEHKSLV